MKKVFIPAILAATVLVAGFFAFMPVERASTVHTFITSEQGQIEFVELMPSTTGDNFQIEIACGSAGTPSNKDRPILIEYFILGTIGTDAGDDVNIDQISFNTPMGELNIEGPDGAAITPIDVALNDPTNSFIIIPNTFPTVLGLGEIDFILDQAGGDISDDQVAGGMLVTATGDSTCAMSAGPDD